MPRRFSARARDLDLDRQVGRRINFEVDVVGIADAIQVSQIEAFIGLKTLVEVLTTPGCGTHGHHRHEQLLGEDPNGPAQAGFLPLVRR